MARLTVVVLVLAIVLIAPRGFVLADPPVATPVVQSRGEQLVQQLRRLPTPLLARPRSDGMVDSAEQQRQQVYQQLRQLGQGALLPLQHALTDPDVQMRRNVALALVALAGNWFERSQPGLDIRACLPALMAALQDRDRDVRAWSAQAIGEIGPPAALAVPALVNLLASPDEGSRNSACIALGGIGSSAKEALPSLRKALTDPSDNVRRFAHQAIEMIEGNEKQRPSNNRPAPDPPTPADEPQADRLHKFQREPECVRSDLRLNQRMK